MNIKLFIKRYYQQFLVSFLMIVWGLHRFMPISLKEGDDTNVRNLVNELGLTHWLIHNRYLNWSSRLFSDLIGGIFLTQNTIYWAIVNSLMLLLLTYSILKITKNKFNLINSVLVFVLLSMMKQIIFYEAFDWITGSFNYLWVAALGLYSFLFVMKAYNNEKMSLFQKVVYLLALICACYGVEQILFCLVAFSFIYLIASRFNKQILLYFVISCVNFAVILVAPGNAKRIAIETKTFYPDFEQVSFLSKLKLGFHWELEQFLSFMMPYLILVSFLVCLIIVLRKSHFIISTLSCLVFILSVVIIAVDHHKESLLCLLLLALLIQLLYVFKSRWWQVGSLYCSILVAPVPLYFSPTIYGSGLRTYFVSIVLVMILIMYLVYSLRNLAMTQIKAYHQKQIERADQNE